MNNKNILVIVLLGVALIYLIVYIIFFKFNHIEHMDDIIVTNDVCGELSDVLAWYGWEVYLRGPQVMAASQGTPKAVSSRYDFYKKLNEALKQSIGNYLK